MWRTYFTSAHVRPILAVATQQLAADIVFPLRFDDAADADLEIAARFADLIVTAPPSTQSRIGLKEPLDPFFGKGILRQRGGPNAVDCPEVDGFGSLALLLGDVLGRDADNAACGLGVNVAAFGIDLENRRLLLEIGSLSRVLTCDTFCQPIPWPGPVP